MQYSKLSVFTLTVTAVFFSLLSQPVSAAEDPCKPLLVMYCTACHTTQRICTALDKKDEKDWKKTIETMGEYGDIDKKTQEQVLQCVKTKKSGDPAVCTK